MLIERAFRLTETEGSIAINSKLGTRGHSLILPIFSVSGLYVLIQVRSTTSPCGGPRHWFGACVDTVAAVYRLLRVRVLPIEEIKSLHVHGVVPWRLVAVILGSHVSHDRL